MLEESDGGVAKGGRQMMTRGIMQLAGEGGPSAFTPI